MIKDVVIEISKHLAGRHDQLRHGRQGTTSDEDRKAIFLAATQDPKIKRQLDRNMTGQRGPAYFAARAKYNKGLVDSYQDWLDHIQENPEALRHWGTYTMDESVYNGYLRDPEENLRLAFSELGDPAATIRAMDNAMYLARFPADTILNRVLGYNLLPKDGLGVYYDKGYQSTVFGGDEMSKKPLLVPGATSGHNHEKYRTELILKVKEGMQGAPVGLLGRLAEEDTPYEELSPEVVLPRHSVFELHGLRNDGGVTGNVLGVVRPDTVGSDVLNQRLLTNIFLDHHLDWESPMHGQQHFESVRRVGLDLADKTGADKKVVELFAYLHDNSRLDEIDDGPQHGVDAVKALQRYKADGLVDLTPLQDHQLTQALLGHSDAYGVSHPDATISTCWDADKLNYGRGDMRQVDVKAMSTTVAADPLHMVRAGKIIEDVGDPGYHVETD